MCLGRNQEEVDKFHTLGRCSLPQLAALAQAEKESNGVSQLHAREVNTDAVPCTSAERMESSLCIR
jgi:hypothetical protein